MGDKVFVLMSSYNGEKYIREQLDSILVQRDVEVSLVIRDDGSSDSTIDIIKEYTNKYGNITFIVGNSCGVAQSFMSLLYGVEDGDYYAFADQDDYWYDDKLMVAIKKLKKYGKKPALYCGNQNCVDEEGNFLKVRFPENFEIKGVITALFHNYYAGCTMVMNKVLRDLLVEEKRRPPLDFFEYRIHDSWINTVSHVVAEVIFDSESHMDFRRYEGTFSDEFVPNQVGCTITERYRKKFKRFLKKGIKRNGVSMTAKKILEYYNDFLTEDEREQIEIIAGYRDSIKCKMMLLCSDLISKNVLADKLLIRLKVIGGIL